MFYKLTLKLLFLLSAEKAHTVTTRSLDLLCATALGRFLLTSFLGKAQMKPRHVMGLNFGNAVGLAAGFDKNAAHLRVWETLGFGFVEVGTVTPVAQDGNPKPRLFRLKADGGVINRMGFNNHGLESMVQSLTKFRHQREPRLIVGGNIGKNKITPNEEAENDYLICFKALYHLVDYFVVNVSSPNTPGLRELQDKEPLQKLLQKLLTERKTKMDAGEPYRPVLLKIAPDVNDFQLKDIIEIINSTAMDGLVVSNTSIRRDGLKTPQQEVEAMGNGGVSGAPILEQSNTVLKKVKEGLVDGKTVIGVGGINSLESAKSKSDLGADLLQVYTGFIYHGPKLVQAISKEI